VRKAGSKKGATVGSGGQRRKGLEGKGPTPKAEDRPYHVAHKRKQTSERGSGTRTPQRARQPRRSAERTHEIVAGRNSVVEALRAGVPATTVWIASRIDADDRTREILREVTTKGVPLLEVGKPELDKLTENAVHQGVAMQVPAYTYAQPEDLLDEALGLGRTPLIVALDGITDPRNLGAALRSAGAFAADGVLVPERRAAGVTASAWKVSAGAAARVPVARATNLVRALTTYKQAGCFVVGLDADGTTDIGDLELATEPIVIVCGSEGKGLSRLVRETCDVIASIPIAASTESLNAGVATGIALYEVSRLRREAAVSDS
jgi:23S rRNA (guanosine2251-2'-O)-methyltransferase